MSPRSSKQVKEELAAERGELAEAVDELRDETENLVNKVKAKLPLVAAAAIALGVAVVLVKRR
jgi:hypothetical protein